MPARRLWPSATTALENFLSDALESNPVQNLSPMT
jgi:hypothetical protein